MTTRYGRSGETWTRGLMVPNHARYHLRYTPMQLFHYNDNAHGCQVSFFVFCGEICEICRFLFPEEMHLSAIFLLTALWHHPIIKALRSALSCKLCWLHIWRPVTAGLLFYVRKRSLNYHRRSLVSTFHCIPILTRVTRNASRYVTSSPTIFPFTVISSAALIVSRSSKLPCFSSEVRKHALSLITI